MTKPEREMWDYLELKMLAYIEDHKEALVQHERQRSIRSF